MGSYWDPIGILLGSYLDPIGCRPCWDPTEILWGSYGDLVWMLCGCSVVMSVRWLCGDGALGQGVRGGRVPQRVSSLVFVARELAGGVQAPGGDSVR